ncbi:hypothetical protein OJAV_G00206030 [Oryzias javanicus]|uniref:Uncharacterized protein n=1 Tax=Oryzias javanicus TaxID=123683 RepID=A0A437C5Z1_ORYJA|nr:hypothetical protein OJAV_G00206030 [Oryzias javanicus]
MNYHEEGALFHGCHLLWTGKEETGLQKTRDAISFQSRRRQSLIRSGPLLAFLALHRGNNKQFYRAQGFTYP